MSFKRAHSSALVLRGAMSLHESAVYVCAPCRTQVKWHVYGTYLRAFHLGAVAAMVLFYASEQGSRIATNAWLAHWSREQVGVPCGAGGRGPGPGARATGLRARSREAAERVASSQGRYPSSLQLGLRQPAAPTHT